MCAVKYGIGHLAIACAVVENPLLGPTILTAKRCNFRLAGNGVSIVLYTFPARPNEPRYVEVLKMAVIFMKGRDLCKVSVILICSRFLRAS